MAEVKAKLKAVEADEENYEDEPDETVSERLWGLTEMFPERMRDIGGTVRQMATKGAYLGYRFSRSALWISVSTLAILVFPIMFESERIQLQEQQQMQQRQILLGPGAVGQQFGGQLSMGGGPSFAPPGLMPK